jgi:UPF0755 protein
MRRHTGTVLKITAAGFILALLLTAAGCLIYHRYLEAMNTAIDPHADSVKFVVVEGWSFYRTALELETQNLVKDRRVLQVYAYLNRERAVVKAGEYLISGSMTPMEILHKFHIGDVITYSITFPEGLTIKEMAGKWETSGFGTASAFLSAVDRYRDPEITLPATGWEGYLFPDTYVFTQDVSEKHLVEKMINEMKQVLRPEWLAAAGERALNRHQVITLASLIEKETRLSPERPLVSSVFHNRLSKGMLLQCDPTVIYALGDRYTGTLLKTHLAVDHPHNTYMYPGLPPGPIGAPGKESLESACFPAETQYLYFVADSRGEHTFSRTLAEHNRAVKRYRDWLRIQKNSAHKGSGK